MYASHRAFQTCQTRCRTELWLGVVAILLTTCIVHASGEPRWVPGMPGIEAYLGVLDMEVFDDGSGEALYVCGPFAGDPLLRWNGVTWESVGSGLHGQPQTMEVFDDGTGPAIFIAGSGVFINGTNWSLAKWNGREWIGVVPATFLSVRDLESFDDGNGSGPTLYGAGFGPFVRTEQGWKQHVVVKLANGVWNTLGDGLLTDFDEYLGGEALEVFDDGGGSCLYVAGLFHHGQGDPTLRNIARWNGKNWSVVGSSTPHHRLCDLTVFDPDAEGPSPALLLACGTVTQGQNLSGVSAWNGIQWSQFGTLAGSYEVSEIEFLPIGTRSELVIAGDLGDVWGGGTRRWDGQNWVAMSSGPGAWYPLFPWALASFDDGSTQGPALFVSGDIYTAGYYPAQVIARWGVPIKPNCPGDMSPSGGDARINIDELLEVIGRWGPCNEPCIPDCLADIDANCVVDIDDLLEVIGHWGLCPGSEWPR